MMAKQWRTGAKALLVGTMAAGLCFGMTAGAFAQDEEDEVPEISAKPLRIRVIGGFPTDGDVKRIVGSPIIGGGLAYDFKTFDAALPIHLAATVDYLSKSKTKNRTRVQAGFLGIGVAPRVYFMPEDASLNFYAGIGAFLSFPNYKATVAGIEVEKANSPRLGGKIFSGVELNRTFFGEFEFAFPGSSALNSFNAALGYRF